MSTTLSPGFSECLAGVTLHWFLVADSFIPCSNAGPGDAIDGLSDLFDNRTERCRGVVALDTFEGISLNGVRGINSSVDILAELPTQGQASL